MAIASEASVLGNFKDVEFNAQPRTQHAQIETCARCHSRRGQIWEGGAVGMGDALPYLRHAAESAPEVHGYAYVHALALNGSGNRTGALGVLETANRRHPADRQILFAIVTISRDNHDLKKARAYAEDLSKRFPGDAHARALLSDLSAR